ncbi:MAG TPA: alpha-L-fucosidase [Verrucomicrobiae bacterium]|jgi:alpha-L-fucosidase|nr:alpha-L-fucosidase [Verrucomicrobiae bacterium]
MSKIRFILLVCFCFSLCKGETVKETNATDKRLASHEHRMEWWREAKFGMFIHWGLYSVPAGTYDGRKVPAGEWIMNVAKIPVDTYAQYASQFNPTNFDADAWVKLAKDAGMKYIVFTAKHHDGFAMFHSKVDGFNIYDATPFHRDPVKELSAACEKFGIKFGVDYSQAQDWHHPGGAIIQKGGVTNVWDSKQSGDFDDYLKNVSVPQVEELLSDYGPIAILWMDTPVGMTRERAALFEPLFQAHTNLIINDRVGGHFKGDFKTPEQRLPGYKINESEDFETCMTINGTWGYESYDTNFKSAKELERNLISIVSRGGNYLLNVGPDANGNIPMPEGIRLKAIGQWLQVNGEAIYGTTSSPFKRDLAWGRCTQRGNKLYLIVFDWPIDHNLIVPIKNKKADAWLMADDKKQLLSVNEETRVVIQLPEAPQDPVANVIVMDLHEPIALSEQAEPRKFSQTDK